LQYQELRQIAGMGSFAGDNDYKAVVVVVQDKLLVECNTVDSSLSAIQFQGSDADRIKKCAE
jgi:hypothetical protein